MPQLYSLEDFEQDLRALLKKAKEAGLDTEDVGTLAESILEDRWD